MFLMEMRSLAVVTLAVGLASTGAMISASGSQDPASTSSKTASASAVPQAKLTEPSAAPQQAPGTPAAEFKLRVQRLATRRAKARFEIARASRELAQVALDEFDEAYFGHTTVNDPGVKLAETELVRAEGRLESARQMFDKGLVSKAGLDSEELGLKKARMALRDAQAKIHLPITVTGGKSRKELLDELAKARTHEVMTQRVLREEQAREFDLAAPIRTQKK